MPSRSNRARCLCAVESVQIAETVRRGDRFSVCVFALGKYEFCVCSPSVLRVFCAEAESPVRRAREFCTVRSAEAARSRPCRVRTGADPARLQALSEIEAVSPHRLANSRLTLIPSVSVECICRVSFSSVSIEYRFRRVSFESTCRRCGVD